MTSYDNKHIIDTFRNDINRIYKFKNICKTDEINELFISILKYPKGFLNILVENTDECLEIFNKLIIMIINSFHDKKITYDELLTFNNIPINDIDIEHKLFKKLVSYYIGFIIYNMCENTFDYVIDEENKLNENSDDDIEEITTEDIQLYKNEHKNVNPLTLRINQKYVLDKLAEEGIKTGIHCQATGCGKSYIILMYCDYFKKNSYNGNIIIFTERVNILADLFALDGEKLDETNKIRWKELGIIDLDDFIIINRVTIKKKDWDKVLKEKSDKPIILVINRAFLTIDSIYKKLTNNHIGLILHDECHSSTSSKCYNFLKYFKNQNVPLVGFSATPLRTGKTDAKFNKDRLIDIYGVDGELNILSNFNMVYAIEKELILPPKFIWYEVEEHIVDKKKNIETRTKIKEKHAIAVFEILDTVIPTLVNKKIIAWCGTIELAEKWQKIFKRNADNFDCLKDFNFYIDHSKIKKLDEETDYVKFKKTDANAILFCANKHREGSDIRKLDCCIFLDFVKNRGAIPFIQSIGRVLRSENCVEHDNTTCNCIIKKEGTVIDSFVNNTESYDKDLVDKIIGYYIAFENINDDDICSNKYNKYLEISRKTKFDKENDNIEFELNNNKQIKIDCSKIKWRNIVNKFDTILQNKIRLSAYDNIKAKSKILVEKFNFNKNSDFINEYNNISKEDKIRYNLPDIDLPEYQNIFESYTWYELLDIKKDFYSFDKLIEKCKEKDINHKSWNKIYENDDKVPKYPKYVYKNFTFKTFSEKQIEL